MLSEKLASIVSDEIHRLQTELRQISQKMFVKGLQDDLTRLRFDIWNGNANSSAVLSPFKEIINQSNSTDVMTLVAVSSILIFLEANLFQIEEDFSSLISCLCNCQYQITSEIEALNLSVQILRCFQFIINENNLKFVTIESIQSMFHYCEQDIRQISQRNVHSSLLSDLFTQIAFIISDKEQYSEIRDNTFNVLFSIADFSYLDSGSYARGAALRALLRCSKSEYAKNSTDLVCISSVLLTQQLDFSDSRDNLVIALRIFFNIFKNQWRTILVPFARLLNSLLDICLSAAPNGIRCTIFEILIDFITQDTFFIDFFQEFSNRPFFPLLFDKFLNVIASFANIPPSVPEAQSSAISVLSLIISQLGKRSSNININMQIFDDNLNIFQNEADLLAKLTDFSKNFIDDPKYVTSGSLSAADAAFCLAVAPGISKQSIGEIFAKNSSFTNETLEEYLKLFDFTHLDFDESIRLFLTSFRILGEGQVVDRNLEAFSKRFYETHKEDKTFKNAEAIHILSYGWLMLHTSLHNKNVAKKSTLPEFFSMLKGQNAGEDFDSQFLTKIFNSIKRYEVEIGDDTNKSIASWELLLQKQRILGLSQPTNGEVQIPKLFSQIWKISAPIFSVIYEKSSGSTSVISKSYIECASISSKFSMHDILDNLVVTLCKFTGCESKESLSEEISKDSLKTLSFVVLEFGDQIHEGWKSFTEVLLNLFRFGLLPPEICTQPVLVGRPQTIVLAPNSLSVNSKQSMSFFSVFTMHMNDDNNEVVDPTTCAAELKAFIKECGFERIIDQSVQFTHQSLNFLIQSLTLLAKEAMSMIQEHAADAAFCLHLITQISIANCERIYPLWQFLSQLFTTVFNDAQLGRTTTAFLERVVTSLFSMLNHLWNQVKLRQELIKLTDVAVSLDQRILQGIIPSLLSGFKEFLSLYLPSYIVMHQFKSLNQLLYNSIGIQDPSAASILHTFLQGVAADKEPPTLERFAEYWMPLLQTSVIYCLRDPAPDVFSRFSDIQSLINFGGNKPTPLQWEFVFESTLFPALEHLPTEISAQWRSNIGERALLLTKSTFKVFLISYKEMLSLPSFETLWFKLVQYSLNIMRVGDADLKASVPQLLSNALIVMKSSGVFQDESRKKMWDDSRAIVEPITPSFSQLCDNV